MMFFLQTRHQQGDSFPLTVDDILDETNQLDVGAKHKHWLATEVSKFFSSSRSLSNVYEVKKYAFFDTSSSRMIIQGLKNYMLMK